MANYVLIQNELFFFEWYNYKWGEHELVTKMYIEKEDKNLN